MKRIEELETELSHVYERYNAFKNIFIKFQQNIRRLEANDFPIRGLSLVNVSDEKSIISFIGRDYELNFSICMISARLRGKISFFRSLDEGGVEEISSVTYNGQSIADIKPPPDEDALSLADESCCLNLVLDWISSEVST